MTDRRSFEPAAHQAPPQTTNQTANQAPQPAGRTRRLGQLLWQHWGAWPLPAQLLACSLAGLAVCVLLSLGWQAGGLPLADGQARPASWWATLGIGMVLGAIAAAASSAWWSSRPAQDLARLTELARQLRPDDAPDQLQLPQLASCAELQTASLALRRMVEAHRARRRSLQQQVGQLTDQLQARTHELSTLQDLSIGLANSDNLFNLVDEALQALENTLDHSSASVWARERRSASRQVVLMGYRSQEPDMADADDLRGLRLSKANLELFEQIERARESIVDNRARQGLLSWLWAKVTDDARTSSLYRATRSWMGLPLQVRDTVLGVLRVDHREPDYFDPGRVRLLNAVASQTALAMHHAQLLQGERDMAVVAERNRIARELHDAVSQTLFAANVIAGTLAKQLQRGGPLDAEALARQTRSLEQLNRGALAEMRMLLFELRPDALEGQSLAELLRHPIEALSCRGDIRVQADVPAQDTLPAAARQQFYRIAQELMTNLARHSGARQAWVQWLPAHADGPMLLVRDDGQGFDATLARPGHFGLQNIHARADEIGARLQITSGPEHGTEARLWLPQAQTQPNQAPGPAAAPPP